LHLQLESATQSCPQKIPDTQNYEPHPGNNFAMKVLTAGAVNRCGATCHHKARSHGLSESFDGIESDSTVSLKASFRSSSHLQVIGYMKVSATPVLAFSKK
jgi:hypothetical protein